MPTLDRQQTTEIPQPEHAISLVSPDLDKIHVGCIVVMTKAPTMHVLVSACDPQITDAFVGRFIAMDLEVKADNAPCRVVYKAGEVTSALLEKLKAE